MNPIDLPVESSINPAIPAPSDDRPFGILTDGPAGYYVATLTGSYMDATGGEPIRGSVIVEFTFWAGSSSKATPMADRVAESLSREEAGCSVHVTLASLRPQPQLSTNASHFRDPDPANGR